MNFRQGRRDALNHVAAGIGMLALGRTGSAFAQALAGPIKIACIYPLSGPLGPRGNFNLTGARIAADQFNRAGGLLGRQVEIVARDDKASPAESALVGRDVLSSGIKFILGGYLTAPGMAVVNLLKDSDALFLLTGSNVMAVTHESFNPRAFRTIGNAHMNMYAMAGAIADAHPEITTWGGATPDNQFGNDNYKIFAAGLKKFYKLKHKKDIEVLDPVLLPFPGNDFKVQIARLMSSPIQGLYTGQVGSDYFTFMSQAKQLGLYNKVKVWADAGQGVTVAKSLGANLPKDNLWTPSIWYPFDKDANAPSKALVRDFVAAETGKDLDIGIASGYVAMAALLHAIKSANSLEPDVVKTALERVEFESINGPYKFRREDHQSVQSVTVVKIAQKAEAPGWEVTKVVKVPPEVIMEKAAPGVKYIPGESY